MVRTNQVIDKLNDLFLCQHVNEPTRYREYQSPNTLDLVITNEEHMIKDISYQPGLGLSDHVYLSFNYSSYAERSNRPSPRFNLYHADFDQLNNLIHHSVDWEEVLKDLDVHSAWRHFSNVFNIFMKECIPMSVPKRKKTLYITQEVKSLKNKRNHRWRRYTISKSHTDYLAYTKARNDLRALTRNLHKQFER